MRTLTKDIIHKIGETVVLMGWVASRRDHGKLIFIDLRDRWGRAQVVFSSQDAALFEKAERLRPEWVVKIEGIVKERPKGMENPEIITGTVEIKALSLEILNESQTPPFALDTDGYEIGEDSRMKYRYLDLRRDRMQKNLILRDRIVSFIRQYLHKRDFIEIETPILTKSTPEGARDYVVPSRLYPGKFYALPQSPQQYKQLLMASGFERYFQIARCFRDEDTRADRQPEFTQLDLEMSFTDEEEIMRIVEELLIKLITELFPDKTITYLPFPHISYEESMEKYKTDKPDLRKDLNNPHELAFLWVTDFPLLEYSEKERRYVSMHHPFTAPQDSDLKLLQKSPEKIKARAYDLVLNGYEIGGGSIRIYQRNQQERIFEALNLSRQEVQEKFGHLLKAFDYGIPPHGGIALGFDRLFAVLRNELSIREVIAFPKTGDARDLMMDAPSELGEKQLKELHLCIDPYKREDKNRSIKNDS